MEPLTIWKRGSKAERARLVDKTLEEVGIDPTRAAESQAHQFSGGQCQRISIARSLVLDPSLIICDEPVSALDVSVQAQVLNLLEDLKGRHGLTLIFIAHDLAVVKNISDRVAVMYLGKLCEVAPSDDLYRVPTHPYTNVLLASIPVPDPGAGTAPVAVTGEPASPVLPPPGCRFHPRCPNALDVCTTTEPELREFSHGHFVACHNPVVDSPVAVRVNPAAATAG
jgi:peptide/nickel transport system ATP-binding protein